LRVRLGALQDIVIVADNDKSGVGQRYAEQACAKHGARLVMPPELGDANDYVQVGGDLALLLEPVQTDWLIHADDFSSQPAPIKWLVRNWIQDQALIMVHGPSGGGKTFVVLDWMLHMAAGLPTWSEQKVKPAEIVYLAGEGHIGLKGRIAAWKYHHQVGKLNMWLSKEGCDLNTSTGYNKVVEAIQFLPIVPKVIVVDTLHRFLHGDENSAQDTKTMLDACANLMAKFSATLILVHHTGVSDEAQHRARGSSAWRGALDIEISIVPAKDGQPMQIVQRKSKDAELAEPLAAELISVEIPKWLDEDGQPVTSAVVQMTDKVVVQKSSKLDVHRQKWEKAWFASGAELLDGKPFLTRSALREKLKVDGLADQSIKNMLNPANDDKMIGFLQNAGVIKVDGAGWTMEDKKVAEILIFSRNETNK
jgi:KaiC/GvpD/RAD55 family RecA-like ATPase